MDKTKILFVCLGNICRSPAAEQIMRGIVTSAGACERFELDSAGTYGGHAGEKADSRMRKAALRRGYDITHRSRQICTDDFERFDRIIVMDDSNYEKVCRLAPDPESLAKVERMTDYCTGHDISYVPDPYYEGVEGFDYVLDILEDACTGLFGQITG